MLRLARSVRILSVAAALLALLAASPARAEDPPADATSDQVKAAMDVFRAAYKGDDDAKNDAVDKLAEIRHPSVFGVLGNLLKSNESQTVKTNVARLLGAYHDKRCAKFLLDGYAANKKNSKVLEVIFTAMANIGDESVVETIGKHIQSKGTGLDKETFGAVKSGITALGKIKAKESVEPLLKLGESLGGLQNLDAEKQGLRNEAMNEIVAALKELTGQEIKGDRSDLIIADYKKWWKANQKTWDPNKKSS